VRELLSNVIKHSGVRAAQVLLQEEANGIKIRVTDQGEGFDVTAVLAEGNGKFGLYTIHERLQLFEGWADIDSQLGAGTRITLFLPHTPYKSKSGMVA
jgi:signal transduction histidine kinase